MQKGGAVTTVLTIVLVVVWGSYGRSYRRIADPPAEDP
jgi:hypothetical protein